MVFSPKLDLSFDPVFWIFLQYIFIMHNHMKTACRYWLVKSTVIWKTSNSLLVDAFCLHKSSVVENKDRFSGCCAVVQWITRYRQLCTYYYFGGILSGITGHFRISLCDFVRFFPRQLYFIIVENHLYERPPTIICKFTHMVCMLSEGGFW